MGYHLWFLYQSPKVVSNNYFKANSKRTLFSDLTVSTTESPPVVLFDLNDTTKQCQFYPSTNLPIEDNGTDGKLISLALVKDDTLLLNLSSIKI
jgi:hypothetical protein